MILVALALQVALAHDPKAREAIELIEKANEAVQNLNPDPPECAHCSGTRFDLDLTARAETWPLLQQCLKKMCPRKTKHAPSVNAREVNQALAPLQKALKEYINATRDVYGLASEFRRRASEEGLFERPEMQLLTLKAIHQKYTESFVRSEYLKLNPNAQETADGMRQIFGQVLDPKDSEHIAQQWLAIYQDRRLQASALNKEGAPFKYKHAYPDLGYQESVILDLNETRALLERAPAHLRDVIRDMGLSKDLQRLHQRFVRNREPSDELTGRKVSVTTDEARWLIRMDEVLRKDPEFGERLARQLKKGRDSSQVEVPVESVEPLDARVSVLKPNEAALAELSYENLRQLGFQTQPLPGTVLVHEPLNSVSESYMNCMSGLAATYQNLPSAPEIQKFKRQLPQIRKGIKAGLRGKFSTASSGAIHAFVDRVQIHPPPTRESFLKNALLELQSRAADNRNFVTMARNNLARAVLRQSIVDPDEGKSFPQTLSNVCRGLSFRPVRDHTIGSLGAVAMGSNAIRDLHFGRGVAAHEIGHGLSDQLAQGKGISDESRKKYAAASSCLANLHKKYFDRAEKINARLPEAERDPRPRDAYVEEDFADVVSALSAPAPPFACSLYQDGMVWNDYDPSDMNLDKRGSHSARLFRIFHVETASGRTLPPQCRDWLAQNEFDMKKCL